MISAYEVGQMSDDQIADMLNEYWAAIVCLVLQAGGTTYIDREVAARGLLDDYLIVTTENMAEDRIYLRAEKNNAEGRESSG